VKLNRKKKQWINQVRLFQTDVADLKFATPSSRGSEEVGSRGFQVLDLAAGPAGISSRLQN
jgi:hypothetical protein